ncbi:hypothetical protein LSG23_20570 (plasmid) [Bacillus velezensis]|uniref:hypothetical protein n=1 Tax=Bacillus velezensis TaxID=492670 RepID=UPI000987FC82|nr:hypothetical protein [Bacillus velezensis]AQS42488.1 hypothetical protein BVH55_00395 [Bacillus velezensis]WNR83196.1 hypothetical protein RP314_20760 [Bacillus velezensis]
MKKLKTYSGGSKNLHSLTVYMSDRAYLAVDIACEKNNEKKTNFIRDRLKINRQFLEKAQLELEKRPFEEIRAEYKRRKQYKRRKTKKGWSTTIYLPSKEYVAVLFASSATKMTLTSYVSKILRIEKEYLLEAEKMLEDDPNIIFERKKIQ